MSHLERLGSQFSIDIPRDEKGYLGRECPECERYFKITPGTGLKGTNLPCHCPYCGHSAPQDQFFTKAQIEYAKSVVFSQVTGAVLKDLKALEFNHRPKGMFGIGISVKVEGRPQPIRHYSEHDLEEEVLCDNCTLKYTVYGSFGYCPDCGVHNSLQILGKNLRVAHKLLGLAKDQEPELQAQLLSDALENGVSAFDGFGRETCQVFSTKANDPSKAKNISFQALLTSVWVDQVYKRHLEEVEAGPTHESEVPFTMDERWAFSSKEMGRQHFRPRSDILVVPACSRTG